MIRLFKIGVIAILVMGCGEHEKKPQIDPKLIEQEQKWQKCLDTGGTPVHGPIGGMVRCVRDTNDAGKSCNSSEECEGFCLAEGQQCTPKVPYFGCFQTYENGATPYLCVD